MPADAAQRVFCRTTDRANFMRAHYQRIIIVITYGTGKVNAAAAAQHTVYVGA